MLCRFIRSALLSALLSATPAQAAECHKAEITAFAAEDYPGRTATGLPTWPNVGRIVAGGGAYRLGQTVWVEDLGSYEVADRGHLGWADIDVLVSTHAEAVGFGRHVREVCG